MSATHYADIYIYILPCVCVANVRFFISLQVLGEHMHWLWLKGEQLLWVCLYRTGVSTKQCKLLSLYF